MKFNKNKIVTIHKIGLISANFRFTLLMTTKKIKPAAIPYEIEYEKAMNADVKKAGIAISISSHVINLNSFIIIIPTTTKIGAVAADGITLTNGAAIIASKKPIEMTTDVKPVRPPALIPADASINVVVFDVPKIPANIVANVSATKPRSIFDLKPLPS